MKAANEHIDPHELLVKYITGEVSAPEKLQVEQWIDADAENRQYYEHFKLIWDESLALANDNDIDEDKAWGRFRERIQNEYIAAARPGNSYVWLKVAAVFLLAVITILFTIDIFKRKNEARRLTTVTTSRSQRNTIKSVATNKVKIDTLPDGSTVIQNKNSTLTYPSTFTAKTRAVALTGEAFFNVRHDRKKPFIIKANDVLITVLGTSFNVKSNGKTTEVIVETGMVSVQRQRQTTTSYGVERGIVSVQKQQQTATLHPGEKLTATDTTAGFKKEFVADKSYRYYFDEKVQLPVKDQVKKLIKRDTPTNKRLYKSKHDSVKTN